MHNLTVTIATKKEGNSGLEKPVQYIVRNFKKGDEPQLAKIYSECFGPTTPRLLQQWYRRNKTQPSQIFIGAVEDKPVSVVEYLFKDLHLGEGVYSKTAGISGVCTDSDYRHKGIVTNLMKLTLEAAKSTGVSNTSLYTGLDFAAHRIYLRFGFIDIMTGHTYTKILNYPVIFTKWVRNLNRFHKDSKIAQRKLQGWEKTVLIHLRETGDFAFRFRKGHFQELKTMPKTAGVEFSVDLQTYTWIMRNVLQWEEAVKQRKLIVKHGEARDIEMFNRILHWKWED